VLRQTVRGTSGGNRKWRSLTVERRMRRTISETPLTRYYRLSNRLNNRLDNQLNACKRGLMLTRLIVHVNEIRSSPLGGDHERDRRVSVAKEIKSANVTSKGIHFET